MRFYGECSSTWVDAAAMSPLEQEQEARMAAMTVYGKKSHKMCVVTMVTQFGMGMCGANSLAPSVSAACWDPAPFLDWQASCSGLLAEHCAVCLAEHAG